MSGTKARILVGGPEMSRVLLDPIADDLANRGYRVDRWFGAMDELAGGELWSGVEIFLCYDMSCTRRELDLAPCLHTIIAPTIGYEWIDADAATTAGVAVINGRVPENGESMAEAAILLILASLYDLRGAEAQLRTGAERRPARMLRGKTVGLVGYGNIARCLARRLDGWGVDLLAYSRSGQANEASVVFCGLDELLERSDVIVLLASLNDASRHMIDEARLARIRADALLVNLARGGLIDEAALIHRLSTGKLAHVALDVFEEEPLAIDSPLRDMPGAILTPHAVGHTVESFAAIPRVAAANAIEAAGGRLPADLCNPAVAPTWRGHTTSADRRVMPHD